MFFLIIIAKAVFHKTQTSMKSFPIYSLFVFASLLFLSSCQKEEPVRPNILILFTDDHRFNTLGFLGNEDIRTPNLDRLAAEGVAFRRAHVMGGKSGAICVPSRAMLLTGKYVHSLEGAGDVIPPDHITMPETFGEAGYTTFFTGKWHNDKPSFVRSFASGGNIFFGGMHFENVGGHFAPWLHQFDSTGRYPDEAKRQSGKFSSESYADAAVDFLQRQKDSDQPFYCHVAFTSPHDPRTPPPGFESIYDPEKIPLPANYLPEHPFDNGELKVRDEQLLPLPRTEEAVRKELALYYAMISEVDAQIGRILEALEKSEKKDNTIIVFAGDNGLAVGSHGLLGKQNLYEHSIRIPMIIAGPGIPKNAVRESFVYLSDIFPTLAALIGADVPPTAEGKDIRPVILRDEAVRDNAFYIYRDLQRGVRTSDNWKLIKYSGLMDFPAGNGGVRNFRRRQAI
jgi:arylsulfatase A-like enzyme